ncbi:MAG: hypothetical protein J6P66_05735 [Bacteroidaceae bacterium]|nr:hypothetical protein [Bacteroidaceae bacterium]
MSYAGIFTDKNNADHPVTSTLYGTCDTAAATAAKVVTCADVDVLTSGMTIRVKFANANTAASPTINVNSTGAKTVYRFGTTAPVDGDSWKAGEVIELLYDGTYFYMVSADDIGSKQDTLTFDDVPTANSNNPVKSGGVKSAIDAAVSSAYHHAGTKTCAELVAGLLVAGNEGNVYNMTDSGTTTSDFIEGAGQPIKAGDNVGIAKISDGVYKFDLLSGFVDTTNFVQKSSTAGLIMNDGTIDTVAKQPVTDNNLTTTDKTTTGAINELKSGLTTLDNEVNGDATTYPYADVITIEDAVPANVADCSVKIEPVQDLHGYDKPWVGGAGDNKLDTSTVTVGNVTFTEDTDGYVSCADGDGRSWSYDNCQYKLTLPSGSYKFVVDTKTVGSTGKGCVFKDSSNNDVLSINSANLFAEVGVVAYDFTLSAETSFGAEIKHGGAVARFMIVSSTVANTWQPYTNICPISGHTEASVHRDGRNFLDTSTTGNFVQDANGYVTYTYSGGSTDPRPFNYSNAQYKLRLPAGSYKLVTDVKEATDIVYAETQLITSASVVKFSSKPFGTVGISSASFTLTEPTDIGIMSKQYTAVARFMIVKSTDSNDYVPYAGKTYTIALGDTIYGGTVDFDSGVMTVDRAYIEFDGSVDENWGKSVTLPSVFYYMNTDISPSIVASAPFICNRANYVNNISDFIYGCCYSDANAISFYLGTDSETIEEWKTYIASNPLQVCYELATPFTIQLTPQQIQILQGTNTLTASTGDISVTVNGVSGAIGSVQEQVNATDEAVAELAEKLPTAPTTDGAYVLTVTVADGTPTYSWESAT